MKRIVFGLLVVLFLCFAGKGTAQAAEHVIVATSLAYEDVQAAVDAAKDGDVILLPAGDVTWTKRLSIRYKGITLQGQGVGETIIRCQDVATTMDLKVSEGKPIALLGLSFTTSRFT